jgi:hypothetical protein
MGRAGYALPVCVVDISDLFIGCMLLLILFPRLAYVDVS